MNDSSIRNKGMQKTVQTNKIVESNRNWQYSVLSSVWLQMNQTNMNKTLFIFVC
ncbi:hypothetical protein Hanom_Chr09g00787621 [Helianthus anomalus]